MDGATLIMVDDETELCELVGDYLGRHGYRLRSAQDGAGLDRLLAEAPAALLILDVNMPGEDGHSIARRIRAGSRVPILMLTSAAEVADRVAALDRGVDDYLVKPFDLRELRARIGAILRRDPGAAPAPATGPAAPDTVPPNLVPLGALQLDTAAHCLRRADGSEVALTAMEYDLLQLFLRNPNRVLTRDRLLDLSEASGRDPFDRSIDIRIARLRRKIEADPARPEVIRTVRGTGYMLVARRGGR